MWKVWFSNTCNGTWHWSQPLHHDYNGTTYIHHKDVFWPQVLQSFPLPIVQGDNIEKLTIKIMEFIERFQRFNTSYIFIVCI
jgi:hypothetical protein